MRRRHAIASLVCECVLEVLSVNFKQLNETRNVKTMVEFGPANGTNKYFFCKLSIIESLDYRIDLNLF